MRDADAATALTETLTDVTSYVSDYVKSMVADETKRQILMGSLKKGEPVVEETFAAVVMIDISEYSKTTSKLAALGKIGSELITIAVCDYMTHIIEVVCHFGGDIVKFLGDAIIVAFRPEDGDNSIALDRAIKCCLDVLRKYPSRKLDVSELLQVEEIKIPTPVPPTSTLQGLTDVRHQSIKSSRGRLGSTHDPGLNFQLHIAITSGVVTNVILGLWDSRLDYVLYGKCLSKLSNLLDAASAGELAIDWDSWETFMTDKDETRPIWNCAVRQLQVGVIIDPKANQIITGTELHYASANSFNVRDRPRNKSEPISVAPETKLNNMAKVYEDILRKFINASIVRNLESIKNRRLSSHLRKEQGFNGQYRTISVIFVKLNATFTPELGQTAITAFLKALLAYDGVFQQYAVDDKGQTMLACFGLPPWTHENEAQNALRAALMFRQSFNSCPFAVSITSGTILFATLGNAVRSEASLLGDIVNQAARLLSVATAEYPIVYDAATQLTISEFRSKNLGLFQLKGIEDAVEVWHVVSAPEESSDTRKIGEPVKAFGYLGEKERLMAEFVCWKNHRRNTVVLVEGQSGIGKSTLLDYFTHQVKLQEIQLITTRGSKELMIVPFLGLRVVMQHILSTESNKSRQRQRIGNAGGRSQASLYDLILDRPALRTSTSIQSISLTGLASELQEEEMLHIIEAIKVMLMRMNENPEFYPLFLIFFTNYTGVFPETELTKHLTSATRKVTLEALIYRLIKRWSLEEKTVLVFDDIQWIDSVSVDILRKISVIGIENGEPGYDNIFLFFCARPLKDWANAEMKRILESPSMIHLLLKGLQEKDVEDFLCSSFSKDLVANVSSEVTEMFLRKTASSPLALQMMVEVFKRNSLFDVANKTLKFALGKSETIASLLEKSVSHAILNQFDRLHPDFQRFLRHASIFGQYFTLGDVNEILNGWNMADLERLLISEDKFYFLRGDEADYGFRHISIRNCIYDSLSYSEKLLLHSNVAKLLERKLTGSNRETLLPFVHYHYWLTSSVDKRIAYAEELGLLYEKLKFNQEATIILQQLIQYVNGVKDIPSPYNLPEHQAIWHATLSTAASHNYKIDIVLQSGVKTLQLLGLSFPTPETCTKKDASRRFTRQLGLLMATKGGRKLDGYEKQSKDA
ncbi:hypothetical protein BC829DRAFT_44966 [Chytridium lagenaria]|nr:hypothetical protein BC829DRAFT_44966 [Chytridium lagenaria]